MVSPLPALSIKVPLSEHPDNESKYLDANCCTYKPLGRVFVWQGHEAAALWRARQVWGRAEKQPEEEEALRLPGSEVAQKRCYFLVSPQGVHNG